MQAFTPTPPPVTKPPIRSTPQIIQSLCKRMQAREAAIRAKSRAAQAAWHAQLEQLRTPPRKNLVPSTLPIVYQVQHAQNLVLASINAQLQVDEEHKKRYYERMATYGIVNEEHKKRYYERMAAYGIVDETASVTNAPLSQQVHGVVEMPKEIDREKLTLEPVDEPVVEVQPAGVMLSVESESEPQPEAEREREREHTRELEPESAGAVFVKTDKMNNVETPEVVTAMAHSTEKVNGEEHAEQVGVIRPNVVGVQPVGVMVSAESESEPQPEVEREREPERTRELEPESTDEVVGKSDRIDAVGVPRVVTAMAHSTVEAEEKEVEQVGVIRPNLIKALGRLFHRWIASLQGKEETEQEQKKSGSGKSTASSTRVFMSAGSGDQ